MLVLVACSCARRVLVCARAPLEEAARAVLDFGDVGPHEIEVEAFSFMLLVEHGDDVVPDLEEALVDDGAVAARAARLVDEFLIFFRGVELRGLEGLLAGIEVRTRGVNRHLALVHRRHLARR